MSTLAELYAQTQGVKGGAADEYAATDPLGWAPTKEGDYSCVLTGITPRDFKAKSGKSAGQTQTILDYTFEIVDGEFAGKTMQIGVFPGKSGAIFQKSALRVMGLESRGNQFGDADLIEEVGTRQGAIFSLRLSKSDEKDSKGKPYMNWSVIGFQSGQAA